MLAAMSPGGWVLIALCVFLAAAAVRSWKTLQEGKAYQQALLTEEADALHRFLSSPRGTDPSRPADILYRLNALMEFERRRDPRWIPLFIGLLADPHPSVVKICHEALREETGVDFRDAENDTLPDPAAWRAWWEGYTPQKPVNSSNEEA